MDAMRAQGLEVHEEDVHVEGKIHCEVDVQDKNALMSMEHERRSHKGRKFATKSYPFDIDVEIHAFQPPSEPRDVIVTSRTNTTVCVAWSLPSTWGGCALSHYELQLREITNKGVVKDWQEGQTNTRAVTGVFYGSVYSADIRVRAYNCGTHTPSEWSEVIHLKNEKEEGVGKRDDKDRSDGNQTSQNETGMAVIVQTDLKVLHMKEHLMHKMMKPDWDPFRERIGEMYIEAGVFGGSWGTMFDLTPDQVLQMVEGETDIEGFDEEKPLMSLAIAGTWVLQTLAHHATNADDWIIYMNEIGSLVAMIGSIPEDGAVEPILTELVFSLLRVYETLRQCDPDGAISMHLAHKYDKSVKKQLKRDWEDAKTKLKNDVCSHVMALVLYDRYKQWNMQQVAAKASKLLAVAETRRGSARNLLAVTDSAVDLQVQMNEEEKKAKEG